MATITKKPVAKIAAKAHVNVGKVAAKPNDGYAVVSIDTIEFAASGRGGGRAMDPAVQKLVDNALKLEIGQGFKVPQALRVQRVITNSQTGAESTLYTYKGAPALSRRAKQAEKRFRTRRDVAGALWLFRVEPLQVVEVEGGAEE